LSTEEEFSERVDELGEAASETGSEVEEEPVEDIYTSEAVNLDQLEMMLSVSELLDRVFEGANIEDVAKEIARIRVRRIRRKRRRK